MPAERPIFVVGAPRSGTTLLRYMLCSHPRIYIPPESNFIPRFFRDRPSAPLQRQRAVGALRGILTYRMFFKDWRGQRPDPSTFVDGLPDLSPATFLDALYGAYARQHGAERWGDKSPIFTTHVDLISEIFPTAQFVHLIRDGRDVALSMTKAYRESRFFYMDVCFAARTWKRRVRRARASGSRLGPGRYYEVRYEHLTADPEAELRGICEFLGETYAPAMVQPHQTAARSYHSTGIHAATRQPLTTASAGRWRKDMPEADQRLFQAVAGDLLAELGYGTVDLGNMPLTERARCAGLVARCAAFEAGGRVLQSVGVFHPAELSKGVADTSRRVLHAAGARRG